MIPNSYDVHPAIVAGVQAMLGSPGSYDSIRSPGIPPIGRPGFGVLPGERAGRGIHPMPPVRVFPGPVGQPPTAMLRPNPWHPPGSMMSLPSWMYRAWSPRPLGH